MKTESAKSLIRQLKQSSLKLIFDHKARQSVNLAGSAKILFDQRENLIGDMLVNTVAFRAIKQKYPSWAVQVLAGPTNREVIRTNPFVDKIHLFTGTLSTIGRLKREKLDIYYCHKNRLRFGDFLFLKYAGSRVNVGRNKMDLSLFDYSINEDCETERDRYLRFLNFLKITPSERGYDFPLTAAELSKAKAYLSPQSGRPVIVFNRYGDRHGKLFKQSLALDLVKEISRAYPNAKIILLCPPDYRSETIDMKERLGLRNVSVTTHTQTIRDSAAIIYYADLVVTPDTSVVHIACAYDIPQIAVYRDRNEWRLWRPLSDKAVTLLPKPTSRDVNDVQIGEFRQSLISARRFLKHGKPVQHDP